MSHNRCVRILILGLNYAPESIGIGLYTTGLAESLAERGHEVQVVAGKPYYPLWRTFDDFRGLGQHSGVENLVSITRVSHYVPSNPTTAKRILHHVSFALTCLLPMILCGLRRRPDIILAVAPSLVSAPVAWLVARLVRAQCWLHIQDFEAEAVVGTGLTAEGGLIARLAVRFEKWVLARFDRISTISPSMCRKLVQKGISGERIFELRNWADTNAIEPLSTDSSYRKEWDIKAPYVALYSGNIANKQGIEIIAAAARHLRRRSDLLFVICGNGPARPQLEEECQDLQNIQFHDLQPKGRLGELLGLATIHLLVQRSGAADLVLPSKMANMMASGRPIVVTAESGTSIAEEVTGCGLLTKPGDAELFAHTIEKLLDDADLRNSLGKTGRGKAECRWSKSFIIDNFETQLLTALNATALNHNAASGPL